MRIQSFCGIKNVGYKHVHDRGTYAQLDEHGGDLFNYDNNFSIMHVELTNDKTRDLDKYRPLLKKYPNTFNPNALCVKIWKCEDLDYDKFFTQNSNVERTETTLFINNQDVDLVSDNMNELNLVSDLIKKVKEMKPDEHVLEENYLYSEDLFVSFDDVVQKCLTIDENGEETLTPQFGVKMNQAHMFDYIKKGADSMDKMMHEQIDKIKNKFISLNK